MANAACPYYMSLGMTCEQFWHGDPSMLKHYIKANEIKRTRDNTMAWLQGAYIYKAIGAALNCEAYEEEPFPMTQEDADRRKMENALTAVKAWASRAAAEGGGDSDI